MLLSSVVVFLMALNPPCVDFHALESSNQLVDLVNS
jgi:hypothetical protein